MTKPCVQPTVKQLCNDWRLLLAFGFGSGLSPIMPGTAGTLAAIPFYCLLAQTPLWFYVAVVVLMAVWGIYLCQHASDTLGVHDHGGIVWDEFVGLWISLIAIPLTWQWLLAGFILFRLFDMLKPWPVSWCDKKVHGGLGIMLDDVVAGLLTLACLHSYRIFL